MKFHDILTNIHFVRIAALLRLPMRYWLGKAHKDTPWSKLVDDIVAANRIGDRSGILAAFSRIVAELAMISPRLQASTDDVAWFVGVLDMSLDEQKAVISMLLAYASAPDDLYTPVELATITGEGESTWRARAMELPGTIKKGKQWLFPRSVLIAHGFMSASSAAPMFDHTELTDADPEDMCSSD